MIIYRDQKTRATPSEFTGRIALSMRELERSGFAAHRYAVDLLIDWGEFETAVTDVFFPEQDGLDPLIRKLRGVSILAGRIFYHTWMRNPEGAAPLWREMAREFEALSRLSLPDELFATVSEGYAYYGLYPETFLDAAIRFHREVSPSRVAPIGLRSIGTSLSAVTAAVLLELGCVVESFTVRPRGHPYDRHLTLSPEFSGLIAAQRGTHFLIVDEGPGLSGSSMGCVAQALSSLGHDDPHIVYFPSWEPERMGFASDSNRNHWLRHRKYSSDFDTVMLESGRLFPDLDSAGLIDISAGKWRSFLYSDPADYPAVFPQHERRKYLYPGVAPITVLDGRFTAGDGTSGTCLYKFVGLGHYGRRTMALAIQLGEAGFSPPSPKLESGFLVSGFIPGRPLTVLDVNTSLLDTIARYLAFLKKTFPSDQGTPVEQIYGMIYENIMESMGKSWAYLVERLETVCRNNRDASPVALDGRMLPHEWIETERGLLKVDGANHFADHFFPGFQDIAWDIAASCTEFDLDREGREYLIRRYTALSGDYSISSRLSCNTIAYLASRLGYTFEAADALSSTPDGDRFLILSRWYSALLKRELEVQFLDSSGIADIPHPQKVAMAGLKT